EIAQVDLRPKARVHDVAAADAHRLARARELLDVRQLLPHHAAHGAGAVAQLQAQVVAAIASLAALGLAHEQDLVDLHAVAQFVQEHGLTVELGADRTGRRWPRRRGATRRGATRPSATRH